MDTFDMQDFLTTDTPDDIEKLFGTDIFGLLDDAENGSNEEEEVEEKPKVVKFKYSDKQKQRLLDNFKITYVNDYGKGDPYHIDSENSFVNQVKNEIHAIYGNRTICQYIIAMRKVVKVYDDMYEKSVYRMFTPKSKFIEMIVDGRVVAPFNHPILRSSIPKDIVLRYIFNENLDPSEITQYISGHENKNAASIMTFDFTDLEEQMNTPVEYEIMPELMQKRIIQSWLSGKLKKKGLSRVEQGMVYGLANLYDKIGVEDPTSFKFDEPISHHPDIISFRNTLAQFPEHIRLGGYTEKDLEDRRKGMKIRQILNADSDDTNVLTIPRLLSRMEKLAEARGDNVNMSNWLRKFKFTLQGIVKVSYDKYGQEKYKYRNSKTVKNGSIEQMMATIDEQAEFFKGMIQEMDARLHSLPYSEFIDEIDEEQALERKYGVDYFTDAI